MYLGSSGGKYLPFISPSPPTVIALTMFAHYPVRVDCSLDAFQWASLLLVLRRSILSIQTHRSSSLLNSPIYHSRSPYLSLFKQQSEKTCHFSPPNLSTLPPNLSSLPPYLSSSSQTLSFLPPGSPQDLSSSPQNLCSFRWNSLPKLFTFYSSSVDKSSLTPFFILLTTPETYRFS